jgi:hypothetical protein
LHREVEEETTPEYKHQEPGTEVRFIAGHYTIVEEQRTDSSIGGNQQRSNAESAGLIGSIKPDFCKCYFKQPRG